MFGAVRGARRRPHSALGVRLSPKQNEAEAKLSSEHGSLPTMSADMPTD